MNLVVLVPFVALFHAVVVSWLPRHIRHSAFSNGLARFLSVVLQYVCELHLIFTKALLLDLIDHLHRRIIESHTVNDVEPDTCIKRSFLNFVCKVLLDH